MARTRRRRRSYSAGEWGRNRVRVFPDPRTGVIQIEWREDGRRTTRSLGHRDWARAKTQADEVAAAGPIRTRRRHKAKAAPGPLTLKTLFDIYGEEVMSTKAEGTQKRYAAMMRMFLRFFGRDRYPATLSQRDWDRFIRERRSGRAGHSGKPASNSTIAGDLTFLLTTLNWAARIEGRAGQAPPPVQSAEGPEETRGEEPEAGASH